MFTDPLTLGLIAIILVLWIRWRRKKLAFFEELGIPGPKPSIICGNLHSIVFRGPHVCWEEWAKKYGKVYGYYLGFKPVLYVGDIDLLKQIQIKDFQHFTDRPDPFGKPPGRYNESKHIIQEKGEKWKKIRSILTPSFTSARMKTMSPLIKEALDVLISKLEEKADKGEEFEIYDHFQMLTLDVIGKAAFGIETNVQRDPENRLLVLGKLIFSGSLQSFLFLLTGSIPEIPDFSMIVGTLRKAIMNKGKYVRDEYLELCEQVVQQRRQNPEFRRADLLQLMLDAEAEYEESIKHDDKHLIAGEDDETLTEAEAVSTDKNRKTDKRVSKSPVHLTDKEIAGNAFVFFLAGYETTSNLLAYATYLMAKHPDVQEKVRQEVLELLEREGELKYESVSKLKYMEQVMQESLRYLPPVHFFTLRECVSDSITYDNITIKKGTMIQVPTYQLHHDPDYWENPEVFDPERFSAENRSKIKQMAYQPFGAGPRNCIGMRFAQMEAKFTFAEILRHFHLEESHRYRKEHLKLQYGPITLTPLKGVYVKLRKRES